MTTASQFFINNALIIYLLLLIGWFFALRGLTRAYQQSKRAHFGLEIKVSKDNFRIALAGFFVVLLLTVSEVFLDVFIEPTLPSESIVGTQTLDMFAIPTSTLLAMPNLNLLQTPTQFADGCIPGQIMITSPSPGDVLDGDILIMGTADSSNFGFYKYEFSQAGSNIWTTILADRDIVRDDELGHWNTDLLPNGDYLLRLVVVNNEGGALPPCVVPIRISGQ